MPVHHLIRNGTRYASGLLLSGSIFAYSTLCNRRPLRNDSNDGPEWLQKSPVKVGNRSKSDSMTSPSRKQLSRVDPKEDQKPPSRNDNHSAWSSFSGKLSGIGSSIASAQWSEMGDRITDLMIPNWAQALPVYVRKLQSELDVVPGSLADEILQEAEDPYINPEITWSARVRISQDLCDEELEFQRRRKRYTRKALARFLDIPEKEIHPDDVPTIAMCGSGGGLRALVAGSGSYLSAQESGLFDCVTYTAGVSGSCWMQVLFNSSLSGQNFERLLHHLKKRLGVHIAFPPPALYLLTAAPTNKYLISGIFEKGRSDSNADFGLVDIYGLLLAARLLVPRGELEIEPEDLKLSNQRTYIDNGANPMPIYTAVRHEISLDELESIKASIRKGTSEETKQRAERESWFEWFEWSPYEFFSEEWGCGIPTWSLGRKFENGKSVPKENGLGLPELRLPQLLGIWGSAFCATLSHYYKEIRPIVQGLTGFGGLDELMQERDDDLTKVHPIDPAAIPNYAKGLEGQLPSTCPQSVYSSDHLQLMDAGMSNNLPIYPLLRPGRDVDILIAFDASADIKKENWLSVADGYARQRGIKGWPIGIGWPPEEASTEQTAQELEAAQASSSQEALSKFDAARESQQQQHSTATTEDLPPAKPSHEQSAPSDLTFCNIWIGSTQERSGAADLPPSKRVAPDADWNLLATDGDGDDAGIAVIYFPFIPNPAVAGVDPATSEFMSTWNFVYTPEQIDKVVALARANFEEGREQTRRCVRAVYERKRRARMRREEGESREWWRRLLKGEGNHFS